MHIKIASMPSNFIFLLVIFIVLKSSKKGFLGLQSNTLPRCISPSTIGKTPLTFAIFPLQLIPKHTTFAASKTKNNKSLTLKTLRL